MYIRGQASVTYVTRNGLAALRIGILHAGKIGNTRSKAPARWKARGRQVQCTNGPVLARETLHVVISILGNTRVILRSPKVQMSRDRLPIAFNKATGSSILY